KQEASLKTSIPLRAVEDHHVDRPGVEEQQCLKLTGTNSSIGLIVLISQCPQSKPGLHQAFIAQIKNQNQNSPLLFFADLVVLARSPRPDPIPNSTVKFLRANGTKSQDLGE